MPAERADPGPRSERGLFVGVSEKRRRRRQQPPDGSGTVGLLSVAPPGAGSIHLIVLLVDVFHLLRLERRLPRGFRLRRRLVRLHAAVLGREQATHFDHGGEHRRAGTVARQGGEGARFLAAFFHDTSAFRGPALAGDDLREGKWALIMGLDVVWEMLKSGLGGPVELVGWPGYTRAQIPPVHAVM